MQSYYNFPKLANKSKFIQKKISCFLRLQNLLLYLHPFMKPTHYYNIRVRKALRCFLAFFMLIGISVSLSCLVSSCGNSKATDKQEQEEDLQAKKMIQGIWINEDQGSCAFRAKGDTIFYPDSLSEPVKYRIFADTLFLENSQSTKYHILKLTEHTLRFVNSDGDEVALSKTNDADYIAVFEHEKPKTTDINQGRLIKRDTVMITGEKRFHAYSQVNPTTYKVLRQTVNEEGVSVDQAYYDNIVHIAVYNGSKALINRDYRKDDFAKLVPKEYISRCILSDITIEKATAEGVHFTAILTEPDTYTSYHINIIVDANGKVNMTI